MMIPIGIAVWSVYLNSSGSNHTPEADLKAILG